MATPRTVPLLRRLLRNAARPNAPRLQPASPARLRQSQPLLSYRPFSHGQPCLSSSAAEAGPEAPDYLSEGERHVFDKLKAELQPSKLEVQDISGGCGSMYGLDIVSEKFKGMTIIKQHQLVNSVLADEIKSWHGVQLKTKAP